MLARAYSSDLTRPRAEGQLSCFGLRSDRKNLWHWVQSCIQVPAIVPVNQSIISIDAHIYYLLCLLKYPRYLSLSLCEFDCLFSFFLNVYDMDASIHLTVSPYTYLLLSVWVSIYTSVGRSVSWSVYLWLRKRCCGNFRGLRKSRKDFYVISAAVMSEHVLTLIIIN